MNVRGPVEVTRFLVADAGRKQIDPELRPGRVPTVPRPWWCSMDDRDSEYVIAVGRLCVAAELAELRLEVRTADGRVVVGFVGAPRTADGEAELEQTGLERTVWIDDAPIHLDEIVRCTVPPPAPAASAR